MLFNFLALLEYAAVNFGMQAKAAIAANKTAVAAARTFQIRAVKKKAADNPSDADLSTDARTTSTASEQHVQVDVGSEPQLIFTDERIARLADLDLVCKCAPSPPHLVSTLLHIRTHTAHS
jgi:hypothetical protein